MPVKTVVKGTLADGGSFRVVAYTWATHPHMSVRFNVYLDGHLHTANTDALHALAVVQEHMRSTFVGMRPGASTKT
jgi:hypothetical protein